MSPMSRPWPPWQLWRGVVRRPGPAAGLAAVAGLLALALWDPGWPARRAEHDMIAVLDITQSMNVADMPVGDDPAPVSRLARSKALLRQSLAQLPCGSRLGLAIFTEYRVLMLLAPMEVCDNYLELKSTLSAIASPMAWTGNSEIAKGVYSALAAAKTLPSHPAVVFFTDGQEAPPLDPGHRPVFNGKAGEIDGLIVGVGGDVPLPIPRQDPGGQPIGTWGADDVMQRARGRASSVENEGMVDDATASPALPGATPGKEHLSSLREAYLQLLARETRLRYHRLKDGEGLLAALQAPELAHEVDARRSLRVPAMLLALAGLLALYGWPLRRWLWPRQVGPRRSA